MTARLNAFVAQKGMHMDNCVFCRIISERTDPDIIVYEDMQLMALVSLHQKSANPGHILLVPKTHVETIYQLPEALHAPLMSALRLLSRVVKAAFSAEGITIRQNNEPAAGQDVAHMHFHVIPRYQGDDFDAREYLRLPHEERKKMADRLRSAIHAEVSVQQVHAADPTRNQSKMRNMQLIADWNECYCGECVPQWGDLGPNLQFCEYILRKANSSMRVLELGAGLGHDAIYLSRCGLNVVASDISPNAVNRCKALSVQSGVTLQCEVLDIRNACEHRDRYHLIYDKGCFHTFFEDGALNAFARSVGSLLAEGGIWIDSSGAADHMDDVEDPNLRTYPRLSLRQIATAVEDGFEIQEVHKASYGASPGRNFTTWVCLFNKRSGANKALQRTRTYVTWR